jgi:hypothetical protein
MARAKRYLGQEISGKVGNVVFVQLNGETYVRTVQNREKGAWTPAQQLHRKRISQAGRLWRMVKYPQVQEIWNLGSEKMNGYALFVKANIPAFATDGSLVDVRELKLSTGNLSLPQELKAERSGANGQTVTVSWQNKAQPKGERLEDELMAIGSSAEAYYSDVMATGIRRKDLGGEFEVPQIIQPATHVYLFFASRDRKEYTESVCFER